MDYKSLKTQIENLSQDGKPILFVLIGIPGCGKSSLCEALNKDFSAKRISSDLIRKELLGNEGDQNRNGEVFAEFHKRLKTEVQNGRNAIADATNISLKSRNEYFVYANVDRGINVVAIEFDTPYYVCVENDIKRERSVGQDVIDRMVVQYVAPTSNEGFSLFTSYCYASWNMDVIPFKQKFVDFIRKGSCSDDLDVLLDTPITFGYQKDLEQTSQYHKEDLTEHLKRIVSPILFEDKEWNAFVFSLYTEFPKFKQFVIEHRHLLLIMALFHDIGKPMCRRKKWQNLEGRGWKMDTPGHFVKKDKEKDVPNYDDYQFIAHETVSARLFKKEYADFLMTIETEATVDVIIFAIENHLLPNMDNGLETMNSWHHFTRCFQIAFYVFDNNGKVSKEREEMDDERSRSLVRAVFSN